MVIPVFKPIGPSTHQISKEVGERRQEKATHTGSLDPMASGVVIVLTGEDRFKKGEYSNWKKTYEFEILVGVETDSHDLLGIPQTATPAEWNTEETDAKLENSLSKFTGTYSQTMPTFSAKRIDGKSYFDLAKSNTPFTPESVEVTVYDLKKLQNLKIISIEDVFALAEERISQVTGEFRQKEILQQWEKLAVSNPEIRFLVATLQAETSKRTYIRALVRDIGKSIGIPSTALSITRTQNGHYSIEDCEDLKEIRNTL